MGVGWRVRCVAPAGGPDPAELQAALQARLDDLVRQMSPWEPASEISRFNAGAPGTRHAISNDFQRVLSRGLEWAAATGGAFDPTLGRLVDLWGFGPAGGRAAPPSPTEIAEARAASGWRQLRPIRDGAIVQPGGMALDLSGIAKGYAVDALAADLRARGLDSFLVDIGGELAGAGVKPDGEPWWAGLEDPPGAPDGDGPILLALYDMAVASSGDFRRFFDHAGRRYAHTISGETGAPALARIATVSVAAASAMDADALCTVLAVLEPARGLAFAERLGVAVRMVVRTGDGGFEERLSPAFAEMLAE